MFAEGLAKERGWKSLIVISWRFHLVRARYIVSQCFRGEIIMRSVQRSYDLGIWLYQFAYQYAGLIKAVTLGCR